MLRFLKFCKYCLIRLRQYARHVLCRPMKYSDVNMQGLSLVSFSYFGWNVFCSRDTSLLERLTYAADIYEEAELRALQREIKASRTECLLDVGANIGLISLPLLRQFPALNIQAFEPGPLQGKFLEITIAQNQLEERIKLHKVALADHAGEADFYVHGSRDASGDGLLDTHTGGATSKIKVPIVRLDDWWQKAGRPRVGVIKMDVEGGELLVLRGGSQFLKICRPTIMLEISLIHIAPYPYTADNLLEWFTLNRYELETKLHGVVNKQNFKASLAKQAVFIARPV
ncbi:MAG: FkbM family methyltransferase [Verrucomicrobia bacterium]|nr:MAG: FkbM family methyltransferase [Verrucomicrobiota bacterium]